MLRKENFTDLIKDLYGNYIESLEEYKNASTKIKFVCHKKDSDGKEHGEFTKTPYELITLKRVCPKCMGLENKKPNGYWNKKENCLIEAKKYKNIYELQKKCYGCYKGIKRNKWNDILDSIFTESIKLYSNPEDKIHCIYVYVFEDKKSCYVGRTKNILKRDKQHRFGCRHSNGVMYYDSLWKFCDNNALVMPQPIILENNLNAKESQIKEGEWLSKYVCKGYNAINIAPTGSLGSTIKWTKEKCLEESKNYISKCDMKKRNQSAYNSAVKNKWIDLLFENQKKPNGYWNNKENILDAALKSNNVRDMIKNFGGAYNMARKLGIINELKFRN